MKVNSKFAALLAMVAAAGSAFAAGAHNAANLAKAGKPARSTSQSGNPAKRGPGWGHAHVKRMARKARNVAKNRRAHRR
jgi:hypothetical protein